MKCEGCLELLEEYLDGELAELEASAIAAHLITCGECSSARATLAVEQEMFSRYDRELEVPALLWEQIAEQTVSPVSIPVSRNGFHILVANWFRIPSFGFSLATAAALIVIALVIGMAYMGTQKPEPNKVIAETPRPITVPSPEPKQVPKVEQPEPGNRDSVASNGSRARKQRPNRHSTIDQSDVLSADTGYQDLDDQDTAKHIEQTQNLLRSIRNVDVNDSDQEIDVTYDKAVSRRLLNENIVLRRDAEMKAKFPTKALLSDLEPFLIDIANLPDQAKPDDVRAIKERVQKTEIVAALIGY
jgi:hypothetical protein